MKDSKEWSENISKIIAIVFWVGELNLETELLDLIRMDICADFMIRSSKPHRITATELLVGAIC